MLKICYVDVYVTKLFFLEPGNTILCVNFEGKTGKSIDRQIDRDLDKDIDIDIDIQI